MYSACRCSSQCFIVSAVSCRCVLLFKQTLNLRRGQFIMGFFTSQDWKKIMLAWDGWLWYSEQANAVEVWAFVTSDVCSTSMVCVIWYAPTLVFVCWIIRSCVRDYFLEVLKYKPPPHRSVGFMSWALGIPRTPWLCSSYIYIYVYKINWILATIDYHFQFHTRPCQPGPARSLHLIHLLRYHCDLPHQEEHFTTIWLTWKHGSPEANQKSSMQANAC